MNQPLLSPIVPILLATTEQYEQSLVLLADSQFLLQLAVESLEKLK